MRHLLVLLLLVAALASCAPKRHKTVKIDKPPEDIDFLLDTPARFRNQAMSEAVLSGRFKKAPTFKFLVREVRRVYLPRYNSGGTYRDLAYAFAGLPASELTESNVDMFLTELPCGQNSRAGRMLIESGKLTPETSRFVTEYYILEPYHFGKPCRLEFQNAGL